MRIGAINVATLKGKEEELRGDEDERRIRKGFSRNSVEE